MSKFRPMLGHIAVELLIVEGPPPTTFSPDERKLLRKEANAGLALLSRLGRGFGNRGVPRVGEVCTFDLTVRTITLGLDPALVASTFLDKPHPELMPQRDDLWQGALVQALGYQPPATLKNYTEDQRRFWRGQRALGRQIADSVTIIVTKYGCYWDAYQDSARSEAVVIWFNPFDGHRPEPVGMVMAHEMGHVFDAPDEYGHCSINESAGFFDTVNANCRLASQHPDVSNPNPRVRCLMDDNPPVICIPTEAHWGWVDGDHDGVADLLRPCEFILSQQTIVPGKELTITGTNVWDARTIVFRPVIVGATQTAIPRVSTMDMIKVDVPTTVSPWNVVEFNTRAGPATSGAAELFINESLPFQPTGTIVWGVLPVNGVPPAPGDRVRILGTGLSQPTAVTFGGVSADLGTLVPADPDAPFLPGDDDFTITLPATVTGTVDVEVTGSSGTSGPFPPFTVLVCQ